MERAAEGDGKCPENLLDVPQVDTLNFWLSHFVVEVRHKDRKSYPAATINNILTGLYHYSKSKPSVMRSTALKTV